MSDKFVGHSDPTYARFIVIDRKQFAIYGKPRIYWIARDRNFHTIYIRNMICDISMIFNYPNQKISDISELRWIKILVHIFC